MDNAVVVLTPGGTVLASSGLPELLGRADIGVEPGPELGALVAPCNGADLMAALGRAAVSRPGSRPVSVRVSAAGGGLSGARTLTFHRIGASFVIGVITGSDAEADDRLEDSYQVLDRIWAGLSEAMVFATSGGADSMPSVIAANDAFGRLFDLGPEQVRGQRLTALLAPTDGEHLGHRIRRSVLEGGEVLSDLTLVERSGADARVVEWEITPVRDRAGAIQWLFGVMREVTVPQRAAVGGDQDPVTGLPNRTHLLSRLERSLERVVRADSYTLAAIAVQVDGLRDVERRLGLAVGNALLEALAWRVRQCLRPGDLIARVGVDRLVVLLDHFAPDGHVDDVLGRVVRATEDPYSIGGERVALRTVGASSPVWTSAHGTAAAGEVLEALESAVAGVLGTPRDA